MNDTHQLLEPMCRACMCKNQLFHSLCDEVTDKRLTFYEIFATTIPQVLVHSNDEQLPKTICVPCVNILINVHKFQQMCIESDRHMRSLLVGYGLTSVTNIADQPKNMKDIIIAQNLGKGNKPYVRHNPEMPCLVKVEMADEDSVTNMAFSESTKEYQDDAMNSEWSDGDDIPLSKSKSLKINSPTADMFQNCVKFEVGDIEIRECNLSTPLATKRQKNDAVTDVHIVKGLAADLDSDNQRPREQYHCNHCDANFDCIRKLQRHTDVHLETNPFVCVVCSYRFKHPSDLAIHSTINHKTSSLEGYRCPECPRRFEKLILFKKHVTNHHHKHNLFQKLKLSQHVRLHPKNQNYKCTLCEATFEISSEFEDHKNKRNCLKSLICDYCNKGFKKKYCLLEHQRLHTGEKPYICSQCGKSFRVKRNLSEHLKRHAGDKTLQCPECPKKFALQPDLFHHRVQVHQGTKKHPCDICGSSFKRAFSLKKHKIIHTGERPHECNECNMTFAHIHNLKAHLRIHTGDKPYKCKHCEKSFAANRTLINHIRIHTGERPYKCDECNKTFTQIAHLKKHQRRHAGDKPYKCKHCEKTFALKSDLNYHIRIHAGNNTYICSECPESFRYQKELREHQAAHFKQKKRC